MRYRKGSIALSETHDLPVMLLVRNGRCIAFEQLRELLEIEAIPLARRRLAWRVDRLADAGYLDILEQRIRGDKVYTIARKGLLYLEMCGHGLITIHSSMERILDLSTVIHWIDLTAIRTRFRRDGILAEWRSEAEVSSENIETGDEYAKDYDAVATLCTARQLLHYGIEYERTTKARERYRELRDRLRSEKRLDGVLYFVRETACDTGRLFAVAGELANAHAGLLFCSIDSFLERGTEAIVFRSVLEPAASLGEMLEQRIHDLSL